MIKRVFNRLTSTAKIDPTNYAAKVSRNRFDSLGYALAGWLYMLRWQKNTRIMSVASILIFVLSTWLGISRVEWAILILTVTLIWLAEFLNAGIEAAVDLSSPNEHPIAQVAKDVASAAVLLGVVASVLIGLLILGPPLLVKLGLDAWLPL